ncbi:hypothetical protein ACFE04_030506 [Oxalis oulophora]
MAKIWSSLLYLYVNLILSIFFSCINAQNCSHYTFSGNKMFTSCNDLVSNSFIHYNHDSSSGTLQIAYRHTGITPEKWVAWAINPTSKGMVGSQALVAYQNYNGTMIAYTAPITQYKTGLLPGNLSFHVSDLSAELVNDEMIIFATLGLNTSVTTLNQVWQDGPVVEDSPQMHALSGYNVKSMGTLNLLSGETLTNYEGESKSKLRKKNVHGVLNVVSWGIMMPIGVIFARFLKGMMPENPTWFYLHMICQTCAYIIGVAGWATGMKLGNESNICSMHRKIGITIFAFGTIQVFALFLRPKPDHKYRFYWNIYHHSIGYLVITLSIVNIFNGFDMLHPEKKYEKAYIVTIVCLGVIALCLQLYAFTAVIMRKKSADEKLPVEVNRVYSYGTKVQCV